MYVVECPFAISQLVLYYIMQCIIQKGKSDIENYQFLKSFGLCNAFTNWIGFLSSQKVKFDTLKVGDKTLV